MANPFKAKPRIPVSIENAQDLDEAITVAFSQVLIAHKIENGSQLIDLDKLRQIKTELNRYIHTLFIGQTKVVKDPPAILPTYTWEKLNE